MYCNIDLDQFLMFFYFFFQTHRDMHLHIYISNIYLGFRRCLLLFIHGTTSSYGAEFWSANGIHMLLYYRYC